MNCLLFIFCFWFVFGISLSISTDGEDELDVHELLPTPAISNISMNEGETYYYSFNCTCSELLPFENDTYVHAVAENPNIVGLFVMNQSNSAKEAKYSCKNGTFVVPLKAGHLGITDVVVTLLAHDSTETNVTVISYTVLQVRVLRKATLLDGLTVFVLGPLVLINKCAFGAKIETEVLRRVLTKPLELSLCLFVQFVLMPLMAVALGFICHLSEVMALALLVSASCPGGGGGYVFSFLINGDITLAITASLMSTLVAIGAMPAVIGTYTFFAEVPSEIRIPYVDIILMLLAIAIPISTGMIIRKKWPKFASKLVVIIKPLSLFVIAGGLIIVIFTSRYVLYGPKIGMLIAFVLPVGTFIVALALSLCLSFSLPLSKAVSLESGLKNTVLGIAVIELSFPQPEADLASILIIMITIGHTLSALLWYFLYLIKSRCEKHFAKDEDYKATVKADSEETTMFINAEEDQTGYGTE